MGTALLERNALAEALSREVARVALDCLGEVVWFPRGEFDRETCVTALESAHVAFAIACPTQAAFAQKRALERLQEIK